MIVKNPDIISVALRMATAEDAHLPTYDNTKLAAYNTCPTWGVVTYQMHKIMGNGASRAMAIECGSAMHEVFAWVRLCTLRMQLLDGTDEGVIRATGAYGAHGKRLFGAERFQEIATASSENEDHITWCKAGAIAVLETGPYYDDPSDKRRTLSNMMEAALAYIDKWRWDHHVWIRDAANPCGDIGIEIPFDMVVEMKLAPHTFYRRGDDGSDIIVEQEKKWRYTGKIDGIHEYGGRVTLGENKTASRLNDAWSMAFHMASQVTGYCLAASVFSERTVRNADIHGLMIPLPRSFDYGGIVTEPVTRSDYHFSQWFNWCLHTIAGYEAYGTDPYNAPKYTTACNRYFRPCSLIPFCDSDEGEQRRTLSEMTHREWSPLHEQENKASD